MDGNGRWAKKRLMPRSFGHRKGVETTRRVVEFFAHAGVQYLTLFAFSSENWNRPDEEVSGLMELFVNSLERYTDELHAADIRICFIGERPFREFLQNYLPAQPGEMQTEDGQVVGQHVGLMYYTLGQREGLGIGGVRGYPEAPWYAAAKDLENNVLIVTQGRDDPLLWSATLETDPVRASGRPAGGPGCDRAW